MSHPHDATAVPRVAELTVGSRVVFVGEADAGCAADDPLYQPVVPAGQTGIVVKVAERYVRIRLDDTVRFPDTIRLWEHGTLPDSDTATLASVRPLP
ncbi:MAG: hypothetical protein EB084_20325 [Proteobacteria bacterium]|nr:hypothetical protein [Pseudomonadota bacterium]